VDGPTKQQTILSNRVGTMRHQGSATKAKGMTMQPMRATQHYHQQSSIKQHNTQMRHDDTRSSKTSPPLVKQATVTSTDNVKSSTLPNGGHRKQASSSSETSTRNSSVSSHHTSTSSPASSVSGGGVKMKRSTSSEEESSVKKREETSISPKAFGTSQRSGSYRRAMEVRPNPASISSSNDSLTSANSTPSTVRSSSGTLTRTKKSSSKSISRSSSNDESSSREGSRKQKETSSAFSPVRYSDPVKHSSRTVTNGNETLQRTGLWTKPSQVKTGTYGQQRMQTRDRPGIVTAPVPSLDHSLNDSHHDSSNFMNGGARPKGYNWVNSYFRNKNNRPEHAGDDQQLYDAEQPELKTNIQPKQNSFLRKVQGKRKVKT